jgi:hypothetical protein
VTALQVAGAEEAPELEVARDLARRALWLAPPVLVAGALGWGWGGAASSGVALVLVAVNFLLAAYAMARAARISLPVLMVTVMASYVLRLGLIVAATLVVAQAGWFRAVPFGVALISAHLVLLVWETRYVSASLAFPALRPRPTRAVAERA